MPTTPSSAPHAHFDTRVIGAGLPDAAERGPFMPGPVFAATYVAPGDPADNAFTYGRYHNPTWAAWERALEELEGGPALAFGSGMAAVAAVLGTALEPGDVLVLPADSSYTTRRLADGWFARAGLTVRRAPTAGDAQAALLDGAKLLWLETPSNPQLAVCDVAALARAAHDAGALVAVDHTTATPALKLPLALGADFSVSSDSKAITGHSDLILGHVATRDAAWRDRLWSWRTQMGAVPGPMEVWLAHRSLGTLALRTERQCASALQLAAWLETRPAVAAVHYPGLPSHPAHAVAARQMRAFGCVVSFDLGRRDAAERFLGASRLIREATSFGGIKTTAERRARWGGDAISEGFIRMSVGCEHVDDLLEDCARALRTV